MDRDGNYVQTARYLESVLPAIEDLHQFLIDCQHNPQLFSEKYSDSGADENVLYQLVESSEPGWIEQLSPTSFRPHHGVHIGLFRSTAKPGEIGKAVESSILDRNESAFHYWNVRMQESCHAGRRVIIQTIVEFI